jgi:hypothetical protein
MRASFQAFTVLSAGDGLPDSVSLAAEQQALQLCSAGDLNTTLATWPWGEILEIKCAIDEEGELLRITRKGKDKDNFASEPIQAYEFETDQCEERAAMLKLAWKSALIELKISEACKTRKFQSTHDWVLPESVMITNFTTLKAGAGKGRMTFDLVLSLTKFDAPSVNQVHVFKRFVEFQHLKASLAHDDEKHLESGFPFPQKRPYARCLEEMKAWLNELLCQAHRGVEAIAKADEEQRLREGQERSPRSKTSPFWGLSAGSVQAVRTFLRPSLLGNADATGGPRSSTVAGSAISASDGTARGNLDLDTQKADKVSR